MDKHLYNLMIRILVCEEDREFAARALEMDLVGYGSTEKEAIKELREMIKAQISFAAHKQDPSLLPFPAEKELFDRWEQAHRESLLKSLYGPTKKGGNDKVGLMEVRALCVVLDHFPKPSNKRFEVMDLSPCA